MGVQFRLGHGDHKPVEDFLSRDPVGTAAITLDTKAARRQLDASKAARAAGVDVYWEPGVERLSSQGHDHSKHPLWQGELFDIDDLATSSSQREQLVAAVVEAHPDATTHITAPHFYVTDERSARLNIDLAEMTILADNSRPTRAVATITTKVAHDLATVLAEGYADAGIASVEVRLSPFGGEDESLRKISDAFAVLDTFRDIGLEVTLGQSGNIGQIAVALGHASSYSVGIGMLENVNHASVLNRQKTPPRPSSPDKPSGGPQSGIYLPGVAATLPRRAATKLLENSDIRASLGCRIGACGQSVRGPLNDARGHYIHARATEMHELLTRPAPWRATLEIDRLTRANQLRERINRHYLDDDIRALKTRTLHSLIDDIGVEQQQVS